MSDAERQVKILERVRWLAFVPAVIMYVCALDAFGRTAAFILSVLAMAGYFLVCNSGRKRMLREHIVSDICDALEKAGHKDAVFELKSLSMGIVIRVYLIRAKQRAVFCKRAVNDRVARGWYNEYVCATQVIDISNEAEIRDAQEKLNEDLVKELKEKLSDRK